jgi:hypothetical protein
MGVIAEGVGFKLNPNGHASAFQDWRLHPALVLSLPHALRRLGSPNERSQYLLVDQLGETSSSLGAGLKHLRGVGRVILSIRAVVPDSLKSCNLLMPPS